jgi:hypothetical protein
LNSGLLSIAPDDKPEPVTGGGPSSWQSLPWRFRVATAVAGIPLAKPFSLHSLLFRR